MLNCDDILYLIEKFNIAEHYYIGKLDSKKDKSVGVYNGDKLPYKKALSGANLYDVQRFTILVHWNNHPHQTELTSRELYNALENVSSMDINSKHIYYVSMIYNDPVDVFTDDNGIYERVIDIEVYSRKD